MATSAHFFAYVLDQLARLDRVHSRRMFGGAGLYCDEYFFGLIANDVLYLRVDDSNRADYIVRNMVRFRPYADRPHLSMSYYEVPAEVLEDAGELASWARRSVEVAMKAATAAAKRPQRRLRSLKRLP